MAEHVKLFKATIAFRVRYCAADLDPLTDAIFETGASSVSG